MEIIAANLQGVKSYQKQIQSVSALQLRFAPVLCCLYLPCSVICAVYFLAIFRRNFNGIIVFYVCIINTNSIHASFLVSRTHCPVACGQTEDSGVCVQAGPGYAYAVYARSYDCYSRIGMRVSLYVCLCTCVCACVMRISKSARYFCANSHLEAMRACDWQWARTATRPFTRSSIAFHYDDD